MGAWVSRSADRIARAALVAWHKWFATSFSMNVTLKAVGAWLPRLCRALRGARSLPGIGCLQAASRLMGAEDEARQGADFGASVNRLGPFLGCFMAVFLEAILGVLEASWAVLGPSWGRLGGLLGRHGVILEASWAILGRSWGPLGPSWGHLGTSRGALGPPGALLGPS